MLPALSPTSIARAGPGREIAIAGAIDEDIGAHRLPSGFCLDHQRIDAALVMHHHAGAERMEQNIDLVGGEQIVGRDLVGRGVVGLRQDFSEDQMRRIEARRAGRSAQADRRRRPAPPDASRHGHWHAARKNSSRPPPCPCRRENHSARSTACAGQRARRRLQRRCRRVRRRGRRLRIRRRAGSGGRVLRLTWRAMQGSG